MKTLMIIETAHGGMYFSLTYLAAFLLAAGMMIYEGFRKGYPRSAWLLIILSGVLFFIIGDKMFTYTPEQWNQVLTSFHFPVADKKTVLGGIIGLFAGIFIAKTFLRFNRPILDNLAIALPVAMAISRIGCLMAGCCHGTPTNLPWGIHYDVASPAWHVQMAQGMINSFDTCSLAVHPAQLYQVIGCLVIALIVWKSRKQWKSDGSMFLFSVLCYLVLRFFVEFVRDPATNGIAGQFLWGLKIVQWLILWAILPGLSILVYREKKANHSITKLKDVIISLTTKTRRHEKTKVLVPLCLCGDIVHSQKFQVSDLRQVLLTIFLSVIVLASHKWFDTLELLTIIIFLIPVMITLTAILYLRFSVAGFRWVVPVILVCSFSFMAQKSIPDRGKNDKITFTEVGISGIVGKYAEELQTVQVDYNCETNKHSYYYATVGNQSVPFYQSGVNASYNIWEGRYKKYSFGARLFYGNEYPDQITTDSKSGPIFGISPYASMNWEWFGFTGGFSAGNMKIPVGQPESKLSNGEIISKRKSWFPFIPSLSVRLGSADVFFAEGSYASGLFPYSSPFSSFRIGIGTGLGRSDGTLAMIGLCGLAPYLKMVYPIKNKFVVEAFYADNFSTGSKASWTLSLGFNYRILNTKKYKEALKAPTMTYNSWTDSTRLIKPSTEKVIDFDGNHYSVVTAGGREWMAENLKVKHYHDGSVINDVTSESHESGLKYTWYAVKNIGNICPAGWHVPSLAEWTSLFNSLGGKDLAGRNLKEDFSSEEQGFHWWSSTELDSLYASSFYMDDLTTGIIFSSSPKTSGMSVRCIRDK
jgi:prolipoprotein diacylglyceryltransferase